MTDNPMKADFWRRRHPNDTEDEIAERLAQYRERAVVHLALCHLEAAQDARNQARKGKRGR